RTGEPGGSRPGLRRALEGGRAARPGREATLLGRDADLGDRRVRAPSRAQGQGLACPGSGPASPCARRDTRAGGIRRAGGRFLHRRPGVSAQGSARRKRVDEIFVATYVLPAPARDAYLSDACRGDEKLRHEVEILLGAHDEGGSLSSSDSTLAGDAPEGAAVA